MRIGWNRKTTRDGLVGLTLGKGLAIATIERPREGRPRLAVCSSTGVGLTISDRELRTERQRLKLARGRVSTVLEPNDYQLLLVEAPRVEPAELRAAVRWRVKELIDFHIDDAVIDVFEIPGQELRGQAQAMMYAVVARSGLVRRRIELLESADLALEVIDIPELALRNIAALAEEDAAGLITLQLAQSSGLILVTRRKSLFLARRIEIGAATLLDAAANRNPTASEEFDELTDLLDSIVLEMQRSIDYYDRHFAQPPLAAAAVAPPGPGLDWLDAQLNRRLGLPVRRLDLNELLDIAQPLDEATQAHCLLAIGAALRQVETAL